MMGLHLTGPMILIPPLKKKKNVKRQYPGDSAVTYLCIIIPYLEVTWPLKTSLNNSKKGSPAELPGVSLFFNTQALSMG